MPNFIGKSLGRYHILEQIGEGGMAIVYKAFDTRLETDVAVKVIRTDQLAPAILKRALKRFEREAKALARLTHANIVNVSDYGKEEGLPYLVMPFLPGGTLKEKLRAEGKIGWQDAARLLLPVAKALAYAHEEEMIHRDVKPANILITRSGDPMLTDFGIAKIIDEEATMDLTGTRAIVGTPEYMAPEQVTAKTVDHRADIYALGVVFYEMVTGRKPFQADTPMAVLVKLSSEPLPRPTEFTPKLPKAVEQVLLKALAKDPANRYQSMGELAAALRGLAQKAKPDRRQKVAKATLQNTSNISNEPKRIKIIRFALGGLTLLGILLISVLRGNQNANFLTKTPTLTFNPSTTFTPIYMSTTQSMNEQAVYSTPTSTTTATATLPFEVTVVNMSASGSCGHFIIQADITTNGAGNVTYKWKRSDGATDNASHPDVVFNSAGTQSVTTEWYLGASGSHWMDLYIDNPNHLQFGRANFSCPSTEADVPLPDLYITQIEYLPAAPHMESVA
jgi:serine/threonine protein kinase